MFLNPFSKSQDFLRRSQAVLKHTKALIPTKKEPTTKILATSVLLLVLSTSVLLIFWRNLPPQLPLFYSRPWGEEQLAKPALLLLPTLLAFTFLAVNTLLNSFLTEYPFLKRALVVASALLSLLALITTLRIIFLVA